ncbi:MAG: YD repeat-containing protein [bacterium]|jgi:YD repeat-containing protein
MKHPLLLLVAFLLSSGSSAVIADTGFDLEHYRGKVVYVDFWASWCTPCRASFPFMQDMAEEHGDSLAIIAINVDESRSDADQFLEQFEINFDIVYDAQGALAESFNLKGMPTSYLYDREGQLIGSHIGFKIKDIRSLETTISKAVINQE